MNRAKQTCRDLAVPVLALLAGSTANAGVNSFTRTGPDGGYVRSLAVQPGHPGVVLASTERGVYFSPDSGASWSLSTSSPAILGAPPSMAFDPNTPTRAFAVRGAVFRSADSGRSFSAMTGAPDDLEYLAVSGNRVYAGAVNGRIISSVDGGVTWSQLTVPWPVNTGLYGISAAATNENILYACVNGLGIYKTTDHGQTWINPAAGSPCAGASNWTRGLKVSPADPNRLLAPTPDGMLLSTDGGGHWTNVAPLLSVAWVVFDPQAPANVLTVEVGASVHRSTDGGASWPTSANGAAVRLYDVDNAAYSGVAGQLYLATPNGPMFSSDNGASFVLRNLGIQASEVRDVVAADDGTIYANQRTGPSGLWRRGAGSWTALDNAELGSLTAGPLSVMGMATAAEKSSLIYAGDLGNGLFRSENGGADWLPSPPSAQTQVFAVAVDPTDAKIAFAAKATGGVLRTIDGGQSFTTCGSWNTVPVSRLFIDRANPSILYATGSYTPYNRVYKSTDRCLSWREITPEFQVPVFDVAIDPTDHQKLYLAMLTGAQRSIDGGTTWEPMHFGFLHGDYVMAYRVLIDPELPDTLWVVNGDTGGFARSVDAGATWQKADIPYTGGAIYLTSGVLDPLKPDTLVAGATSYGLVEYQVAPDLQVSISAQHSANSADTTATGSVQVRNVGAWDSSAAEVTIGVPSFITVSVPAGCARSGTGLLCKVSRPRSGQSVEIPLSLAFGSVAGSGALTASISGHEADPVTNNNASSYDISSQRLVDLQVDVQASKRTVENNSVIHFTVHASNRGPTLARNSSVTLDLKYFDVSSIQSTQGACTITGPVGVCPLGTLSGGNVATLEFDGTVRVVGDVPLSVTLRDDVGEFKQASDSVLSTAVSDVSVSVTDSADPVPVGTAFQYNVTASNVAGDTTYIVLNASVTGATVTGATAPAGSGTCTNTATTVACDLFILSAGRSTPVSIAVTAGSSATASISATVTPGGRETVPGNNTVTTSTAISGGGSSSSSSSSSSGGGGGGGRFDWLALGLLGLLLAASRGSLRAPARR